MDVHTLLGKLPAHSMHTHTRQTLGFKFKVHVLQLPQCWYMTALLSTLQPAPDQLHCAVQFYQLESARDFMCGAARNDEDAGITGLQGLK